MRRLAACLNRNVSHTCSGSRALSSGSNLLWLRANHCTKMWLSFSLWYPEGHDNPSVLMKTPESPEGKRHSACWNLFFSLRWWGGGVLCRTLKTATNLATTGEWCVNRLKYFHASVYPSSYGYLRICLHCTIGLNFIHFLLLTTQKIRTTASVPGKKTVSGVLRQRAD